MPDLVWFSSFSKLQFMSLANLIYSLFVNSILHRSHTLPNKSNRLLAGLHMVEIKISLRYECQAPLLMIQNQFLDPLVPRT